jgi:hypothetical protein
VCGTLTSSSKVRPSPLPEMAQPRNKTSSREVPRFEKCHRLPEMAQPRNKTSSREVPIDECCKF